MRLFQSRDLRGILSVESESFGCDAWPAEVFREYAELWPKLFLVATVDDRIAGYSIASLARGNAELASIAVASKHRGQGVGSALLKATIRKVRRAGAGAIWLMVRPANRSAVSLYEHRGFVRTSTVARYYEDGSAGWRMKLVLKAPVT
jgi:ribosomal-protein-alanine acetyltransferase